MPTERQSQAQLITFIALIVFGATTFFISRFAPSIHMIEEPNHHPPIYIIALSCIAIGVGLFLMKVGLFDQLNTPIRQERFVDGQVQDAKKAFDGNFNNEVSLIGANWFDKVRADQAIRLEIFWTLRHTPINTDYSSIIHLRDANGHIIAETGSFMPAGLATSNWLSGYFLQENLELALPIGTPPGIYSIDVGLYVPNTQERINVLNSSGNPEDVKYTLGLIEIIRPEQAFSTERTIEPVTQNPVELLSLNIHQEELTVGDEIDFVWAWVCTKEDCSNKNLQGQIIWQPLATSSEPVEMTPLPLISNYPTINWQINDLWKGNHRIYVPANLEDTNYTIHIQLVDTEGQRVGTPIHTNLQFIIKIPDRNYVYPEMGNEAGVRWNNGMELLGYDINPDNTLRLYWSTDQWIPLSLRLFVHILGSQEQIIAQTDRIPSNWSRPTSGWDVDEIIVTEHIFELELSESTIRVGWYEELSGTRSQLADESDFLDIIP